MATLWRDRGLPAWSLLVLLAVVVFAGRLVLSERDRTEPNAVVAGPPVGSDVVHLHAVARNPSDGVPYLATHTGVFRVDAAGPVRIADRYQDTMNLVPIGPDAFLASGHPDLREDLPSRLGLIQTDDAGQSWTSVSLNGSADIHALVLVDDLLFAADATDGVLLVSADDGETWETRGEVELVTLAVDPSDARELLGVDFDGRVVESVDGGATWRATAAPTTIFTSMVWGQAVDVLAAGADGTVWTRSPDAGWVQIGDLGGTSPVLALDGDGLLAAVDGGQVLQSTDGGRAWEPADLTS